MKSFAFDDGKRLIITVEDITEAQKEILIKRFNSTTLANANVLPINKIEFDNEFYIPSGIYAGRTPMEILNNIDCMKEEVEVISEFNKFKNTPDFKYIKSCLLDYLKRKFKSTDASKYASNLTQSQSIAFKKLYSIVIPMNTSIEDDIRYFQNN